MSQGEAHRVLQGQSLKETNCEKGKESIYMKYTMNSHGLLFQLLVSILFPPSSSLHF